MITSTIVFYLVIFLVQAKSQHRHEGNACETFAKNDSSPRIVITGGAGGNIGAALTKKLRQMNFTSVKIIIDMNQRQHGDYASHWNQTQASSQISKDICVGDLSFERVSHLLFVNAEWVIHLASIDARHNFKDRSAFLRRLLRIDSNVLKSVSASNIDKYLFVGMAHNAVRDPLIARRGSEVYPKHPVGWAKFLKEYEVSLMRSVNASVLELSGVYGDGAKHLTKDTSSDVSSITYRATADSTGNLTISPDGILKRDYIFVEDVVNAIISKVEGGGFEGSSQIGSGYTTSLQNVTDYIANLTGQCLKKKIKINLLEMGEGNFIRDPANIERGREHLPWNPMIPINIGIAMNYAWVLKDMAKRNTSNREQLLQYANCIDNLVKQERQKALTPSALEPEGDNVILSRPSGLFTTVVPFSRPSGLITTVVPSSRPPGLITTVVPKFFCPGDRKIILNSIQDLQVPRKTLVLVTTSTRANRITFESFQSNVLDVLNADLALSVETQNYPVPDKFRSAAKYIWEINPPQDFDFMHYYDQISTKCFNHRFNETYAEIIGTVGTSKSDSGWLGCIKAAKQNACCAQMLFYRWFALQNILKEKLYLQYDTVIVTRSDFYWAGPHEKLNVERGGVYIPIGVNYHGVYDRHYVLSMYDAISALGHAEVVLEREDPNEQKKYLISQGSERGSNLEWAHQMWLNNICTLNFYRYNHSAFLVTDPREQSTDRWTKPTEMKIRGKWMMVKYPMEVMLLHRFNLQNDNGSSLQEG